MKTIVITLIILLSQLSYGQSYFHNDTEIFLYDAFPTISAAYSDFYYAKENISLDSINLEGEHYTVKRRHRDSTIDYNYLLNYRNNKLYLTGNYVDKNFSKFYQKDLLVFDYNLVEGDTFTVKLQGIEIVHEVIIENVDTFKGKDSITRKQFKFRNIPSAFFLAKKYCTIFDSVGTTNGFLFFSLRSDFLMESISICSPRLEYKNLQIPKEFNEKINNYCDYEEIIILAGKIRSLNIIDLNDNGVSFYPNPFSTIFTIENKDGQWKNTTVSILDNMGRIVYENPLLEQNKTIDLNHLEDGIFFLRLETKDRTILNKIVKRE